MSNNKVSLDIRTWMMLMGMMVTAITILSSLALLVFEMQTDAVKSRSAHAAKPAHAVQIEVNRQMRETNKSQQKKVEAMYDNVLLIGERVRAKNLQRVEE